MDINLIIEDQNRWWREPGYREVTNFTKKRDVFERVKAAVADRQNGRAAVLLGPRQVGKTTILLQLADDLLATGFPAANLLFFDFSDERLVEAVSPRDVLAAVPTGMSADFPRIVLFDEIQNVRAWERWLKTAVDQSRRGGKSSLKIVVTGSAARSLRDGAVESGQGRWDEIPIEGLTFSEFLTFGSPESDEPVRILARDPQAFERYLEVGGFPEHVAALSTREVRRRIRDDIVDRAILRDLRQSGLDLERVRNLFVYLVSGSGNAWTQGKRADDLEANRKSVGEWLALLEGTRLITRLERDRRGVARARTALRAQPKIFASDHGLISAFAPHPDPLAESDVRGRIFEAVVFRHLRAHAEDAALGFFRLDDDLEVDFVVRRERSSVGIEVTSSVDLPSKKISRTADAMSRSEVTRRLLIYGGRQSKMVGDLELVPLSSFLLAPDQYLGSSR